MVFGGLSPHVPLCLQVGWPAVLVCLGLRGFPGHWTSGAETGCRQTGKLTPCAQVVNTEEREKLKEAVHMLL